MAGNKINTKNKGKEDKNKNNKVVHQTNEDNDVDEVDFSLLRKPILTSITGFGQARKIFDLATEELKTLLSNECDLLYECKVCRNMFRSLANFISHKRVYCKETFNSSVHSHFVNPSSAANEILKIKRFEETLLESLTEHAANSMNIDEYDSRIPLTKDLTSIIEKISKNKGSHKQIDEHVVLQKIPNSSVAVYQNMNHDDEKIRAQVAELDNILSRNKAVLQSDGVFITQSSTPEESVIQISDDEENGGTGILKCKICDQQFSTQKTLKFHMKYKHLESRLVYPCPDCLEIFSTSWSVYRHLFKVHRKSAAQIRKLRESIQAKAFRMNNPPAFYEKRKNVKPAPVQKITEEERLDQENQAWMDNVEGDGDTPRCFGCGRTFERRAALVSHTHTCQPRSRALAGGPRRPLETKKIEIQIRKDYNKGPSASLALPLKTAETTVADQKHTNETTPTKIIKEDNNVLSNQNDLEESAMDTIEEDSKSNDSSKSPEKVVEKESDILTKIPKLPFAYQAEKSNLAAFKQKIQLDIDVGKMLCKRCNAIHDNVQVLYVHMAEHYKWLRYACKLCNFKNYDFDKVPEHVRIVHKLKGDTDFYFSTVKAIDGVEALELSESLDEISEVNDISPDSRRPSRCSSDSSRLSDDSSSSSTRVEAGSRKRKIHHVKSSSKRKKESLVKDDEDETKVDIALDKDMVGENYLPSKTFEENSSDMDDVEDKNSKKHHVELSTSVASRRPVRKRTKPKNEDFEYDLSNLLKMEAQGYRDSQSVTNTKSNPNKKRVVQSDNQNYYENINKDCCGALATLSKKAVDKSTAHMKSTTFLLQRVQKDTRLSNIFVRPLLPKVALRGEKISPRKEVVEESKETPSPQKEATISMEKTPTKANIESEKSKISGSEVSNSPNTTAKEETINKPSTPVNEPTKSTVIPAVVPIKFRRQSLDVIKNNPIINKNITDFTKAGMKTKILLIKPINRSKDSAAAKNATLKFQTIKIKDPSKASSSKEVKSDQVVLVKVPTVDSTEHSSTDSNNTDNEKISRTDDAKIMNTMKKDNEVTDLEVSDKSVETIEKSLTLNNNSGNLNHKNVSTDNEITIKKESNDEDIIDEKSSSTNFLKPVEPPVQNVL